jgi:hypothetical protein
MNIVAVPKGSQIQSTFNPQGVLLHWKNPDNPLMRFGMAAFLIFWLGGWYSGETTTAHQLWTNFQQGKPLSPFMVFWLGGWTIGGIFACGYLFVLLKGAGRAELTLGGYELIYKPGRPPINSLMLRNRQLNNPLRMVRGGKTVTARKQDITGLRIGYAGDQLRVTFDLGADRVEVGEYLTEPEKEWLHKTLEDWLR